MTFLLYSVLLDFSVTSFAWLGNTTLAMLFGYAAAIWFQPAKLSNTLVFSAVGAALAVLAFSIAGSQAAWLAVVSGAVAVPGLVCTWATYFTRERGRIPRLRDFYDAAVKARRVRSSKEQLEVVDRLDELSAAFGRYESKRYLPWASFLDQPAGVYLHGPAGRGKSFLLDGMFDVSPSAIKFRLHFHELMRDINKQVNADGVHLDDALKKLLPRSSLVVIDEVNPLDIATAMFFVRLMDILWRRGCSVSISSNQAPEQLFAGLSDANARLEQFHLRLADKLEVVALVGDEDYRLQKLSAADLYQHPITAQTDSALRQIVELLAEDQPTSLPEQIGSRLVECRLRASGIAWFDFSVLCEGAYSYEDYLQLIDRYPTLIVAGVEKMLEEDPARRFAWLVEIVYDKRRRLILSAHVPVKNLFGEHLSSRGVDVDYTKIISRLNEMQSSEYNYTLAQ